MGSQHIKPYTLPSRSKANRTSQNLSISMSLPTPCRVKENNEMATMAKKHRGFGGKLEFRALNETRQTKILIMKKEN